MSSIDNNDTDPAAQLTDFALEDLQLRAQPFTNSPAEGESFLDSIADAQLDDIKQALISGDDLLLILGPEGSGKSTLLAQLGTNSGQRIQCFSVRGSERFSTSNLFSGMLEAFKKEPPGDLKLMLDDLIPCLQGMADHNTLGAVVLDDADLIPESELTKLLSGMLYINSSDETLLRVTLAAPTEFEERIPELLPEGADLPYSSLAIDAFDKDRSAAYLHHRLKQAGAGNDFPFTDDELTAINAEAGGRPGHLHAVAAQQLNSRDEGYIAELPPELAGKKKSTRAGGGFLNKIGGTKLIVGALALLMIFAGLFLLKPNTNTVPDNRYTVGESKKIELDSKENEIRLLKEQQLADQKQAAEQAALDARNQAAEQKAVADNTASESITEASAEKAAADAAAKAEAAKAQAQQQAKLERDAALKADREKKAKEEAAKAAKVAQEQAAEAEAAKKAADDAAKKTAAVAQANLNNLESPNWILVQNPSLFTVQMIADTDRAFVESFLSKANLDAPNSIFSFDRAGVTWFALVHGLYGSIEEARKDIEKMPENARSNQPWIRAVGRIQNALKDQN